MEHFYLYKYHLATKDMLITPQERNNPLRPLQTQDRVLGMDESLRPEQVALGGGGDVGQAVRVADKANSLAEIRDRHALLCRSRDGP